MTLDLRCDTLEDTNADATINKEKPLESPNYRHHQNMLDIYYTDPSITVAPEDPGNLELAGSIDLNAHRSLALLVDKSAQTKIRLKYFEDSMLKPVEVETLLELVIASAEDLESNGQAFAAFEVIRGILESAVSKGMGLITFSD
ncbi:hypothetical protein [Rhizobium sp. LEGMi135b]